MLKVQEIKRLLGECTIEERCEVFQYLRGEIPIHPLEHRLNTRAEVILEAFSRADDLTLRGFRGIIAEASFTIEVVGKLTAWTDVTPPGDNAYDCMVRDASGTVRVQVKMQRQKVHRPMMANEGYRFLPDHLFVVETQRTRGGTDADGKKTRPYRFGEFDILAVCLHPSSSNWSDFVYTVADWLIPDPKDTSCLLKFQPVSPKENEDWTTRFLTVIDRFRSQTKRTIFPGAP